MTTADQDSLQPLRARGAPEELLARLAASGLPGKAACVAVAPGPMGRLRARFLPQAPLSKTESARLAAVAALAADVLEMEGNAQAAQRFWTTAMPWLGGMTPAATLARPDGPGVIDDLVNRLKYGIPP
jgi:uncharacterized protein (DUF2384 family)